MTEPGRDSFDPLRILAALEQRRVAYVLIGQLARVIHGTDEIANDVEVCPRTDVDNLSRLRDALADLQAALSPRAWERVCQDAPETIRVKSAAGELIITPRPEGAGGYDDLRRKASREPLGDGVRAAVASSADLARLVSAAGRPGDEVPLAILRRIADIDRGLQR
jgi:hypothetical protein